MKRVALVIGMMLGACFPGGQNNPPPDAAAKGSGSQTAFLMEPNPQDIHLELVVVSASLIVILAPLTRRRRRDTHQL
jgi:hypothetical protein